MIRKLRWKITGVTLLVASVILLAVFAGVYYFSQANIAESYTHQLRQAVQNLPPVLQKRSCTQP